MSKLEQNICEHEIDRNLPCIRCRMEVSFGRLRQLGPRKDKASEYEKAMHENDIKLFNKMLQAGKRTL